ncbi:helix-turn-helix transcriptional regulator [Serratia sp. BIGb0163]|uniref:helix-turn-helix domain-containing protein n=1 Tax=Serratia sp. BIGb0163 TaxID=2940613 RepID=UPI00216A2336|nr:helix-turn-helix transcriptional regulator [Serratia sp. BIGb0163]MCS4266634.1 transcriptional regulator with XRE-family HTH domain [Serratia sp. BIGb0163]
MTESSSAGKKIRQIREAEGIGRTQLAEMIGISYNTLTNYEMKGVQMTERNLKLFLTHPRFQKYTLWLMTDQTAPAVGQISPFLSPNGQDETKSRQSDQKAG